MDDLLHDIDLMKKQQSNTPFTKKGLEGYIGNTLSLVKQRSVFTCQTHSFRVSEVRGNTKGFSNVVLSLSTLLKYDDKPFVVIVVRDRKLNFLLSNTTFLKKISHSSHTLTNTNIKGSFLGQDIFNEYENLSNEESNFPELIEVHNSTDRSENIERLVNSTQSIVGKNNRYEPTKTEVNLILTSPQRHRSFFESEEYKTLAEELDTKIQYLKDKILKASYDENVNTRGNTIEQIITDGINEHKTEDMVYVVQNQISVSIDIKTKLNHLNSSPKAFNIDKTLKILSKQDQLFCFLILIIDIEKQMIENRLIPVLASEFISMLRVQHHWAGRNSRGVTQISGNIEHLLNKENSLNVNLAAAEKFLQGLLDI